MKTPRGWTYAGVHAGIKAVRKDLALFASEAPCTAAGLFTINKAKAAPIVDAEARLPASGMRGLVINSANANALTGAAGVGDARAVQAAVARALGVGADTVLSASTGVIGVRLPVDKLADAAPKLVAALRQGMEAAAEAIMTTDTRPKLAGRVLRVGGAEVTIAACGKGSGMIAPSLATMIAVVTTDLRIDEVTLRDVIARAADETFHDLVIDGEMSTNDCVFAFANGLAENAPLAGDDLAAFEASITEIFAELTRAIAEDGEGATKVIEVTIDGAPDRAMARDLARTVVGSTLVKAAVFGADANWGRVLAAIGARAGARELPIDPHRATVTMQDVVVYTNERPTPFDAAGLRAKMRQPVVRITVDLACGDGSARALGCDLSYDYVKINADYAAQITASPEGTVTKDGRLGNYTPGFKRALLVEALSYIGKFAGRRAVVCARGEALVKESLKASLAADINLLDAAGLLPVVVHGGGPEIARTLDRLGLRPSDLVGGDDHGLVEMVLSGRVNGELVSALNAESARAVGLSGKDAGLLRAKRIDRDHRLGEITHVDASLLELLLGKEYIPVISPIGMGDDGEGYHLDTHAVAAETAIAIKADKLIVLADAPGILQSGELLSELTASELRTKIAEGVVSGGMLALANSVLRALEGGVPRVHVVDGRVPHGIIAELFTDRGVGTLVLP